MRISSLSISISIIDGDVDECPFCEYGAAQPHVMQTHTHAHEISPCSRRLNWKKIDWRLFHVPAWAWPLCALAQLTLFRPQSIKRPTKWSTLSSKYNKTTTIINQPMNWICVILFVPCSFSSSVFLSAEMHWVQFWPYCYYNITGQHDGWLNKIIYRLSRAWLSDGSYRMRESMCCSHK